MHRRRGARSDQTTLRRRTRAPVVLPSRRAALAHVEADRDVHLAAVGNVLERDHDGLHGGVHRHGIQAVRGAVVEQVADLVVQAVPRRRLWKLAISHVRQKRDREVVRFDDVEHVCRWRDRNLDRRLCKLKGTRDSGDRARDLAGRGNRIEDFRGDKLRRDRFHDQCEYFGKPRLIERLQEVHREGQQALRKIGLIGHPADQRLYCRGDRTPTQAHGQLERRFIRG